MIGKSCFYGTGVYREKMEEKFMGKKTNEKQKFKPHGKIWKNCRNGFMHVYVAILNGVNPKWSRTFFSGKKKKKKTSRPLKIFSGPPYGFPGRMLEGGSICGPFVGHQLYLPRSGLKSLLSQAMQYTKHLLSGQNFFECLS